MYVIDFDIPISYFELELDDEDLVLNKIYANYLFDKHPMEFYAYGVIFSFAVFMDKPDNILKGTIKEIRDKLNISQYRIRKILKTLEDNNYIKTTDDGIYVNPLLYFGNSVSVETCRLFGKG